MKNCEVCGRPIKSGWKYCFEHRNTQSGGKWGRYEKNMHYSADKISMMGVFTIAIGIIIFLLPALPIKFKVTGFLLALFGGFIIYIGNKQNKGVKRSIVFRKEKESIENQQLREEARNHWKKKSLN